MKVLSSALQFKSEDLVTALKMVQDTEDVILRMKADSEASFQTTVYLMMRLN